MRLHALQLYGFTTFDVPAEVDFDALGEGVFAITGPNGAGKTTLLECMCPAPLYRAFPSRSVTGIASYVGAKGGGLDLRFSFAGERYRAAISVTKSGTTTATLYTATSVASSPWAPLSSGKLRDFDRAVTERFGTKEALFASVFGRQDGGGSFEALTKADRKRLFSWYMGLERWDAWHRVAKDRLVACGLKELEEYRTRLALGEERVNTVTANLDSCIVEEEVREENSKVAIEDYDRLLGMQSEIERAERYSSLVRRVEELHVTSEHTKTHIKAAKLVEPEEVDEGALEADRTLLGQIKDGEAAALTERTRCASVQRALGTCNSLHAKLGTVPCGGEGEYATCGLISDAVAAGEDAAVLRQDLDAARRDAETREEGLRALCPSAAFREELVGRIATRRAAVEASRSARKRYVDAKARIASLEAKLKATNEEILRVASELTAMEDAHGKPDPAALPSVKDLAAAKARREEAQAEYSRAVETTATMRSALEHARSDVATSRVRVEAAEAAAKDHWIYKALADACGPTGIPVYEMDHAGPEVSATINDLLESCFDDRFVVRLATTKEKKAGGLKEDFDFEIVDSRSGDVRELGQVSGGEQTVIGEAIKIGFALYQARKRGAAYETMFRDEPSGSLSPENAERYVQMLARARKIGGFRQVFFVTHNPDIPAMCDATLTVDDGKVGVTR